MCERGAAGPHRRTADDVVEGVHLAEHLLHLVPDTLQVARHRGLHLLVEVVRGVVLAWRVENDGIATDG